MEQTHTDKKIGIKTNGTLFDLTVNDFEFQMNPKSNYLVVSNVFNNIHR